MGFELRRWLRSELGHDIAGLPRAVALEIADDANNATRMSFASLEQLALWTAAKNERVVRDAIHRLAAAGWEFRVPFGTGKDGRLVYAVPGRKLTFKVPKGRVTTVPYEPQGTVTAVPSGHEGTVTTAEGTVVTAQGTVTTVTATVPTVPFSSAPQISSISPHCAAPDDREPDGALFPPPADAAQPRGTKSAAKTKPSKHEAADALVAAFWEFHKSRTAQPFIAVRGVIRTALANGLDRDDVARALDRLANEGRAISGGTLTTALGQVQAARQLGADPTTWRPTSRPADDLGSDAHMQRFLARQRAWRDE